MSKTARQGGKNQVLVEKMRHRLSEDSTSSQENGWDELWQNNVTPWDINMPTPALEAELLTTKLENHDKNQTYKILVPGCGSGFDLLTMARHQDQWQQAGLIRDGIVVGLDISLTSLKHARQVTIDDDALPTNTTSCVTLAHGDFFDCNSWKSVYCSQSDKENTISQSFQEGSFDLIYDYVFFCALPPKLRPSWGNAVSSLLKPVTGRLLTLMFPVLPNAEVKGPPYPVTVENYRSVLEPRGVVMESRPYESQHTIPPRAGKELVCWWRRDDWPRSSSLWLRKA